MGDRNPEVTDKILKIRDLTAGYGASEVLHRVNLDVEPGEIVTLVGANGAGKTTTLCSIYGLTDIREGRIQFKDKNVTGWKPHRLTEQGLAFAPQERSIFPSLSVYENLEMGGYALSNEEELLTNIEKVFDRFPRLEERRSQRAGTLSGGERKMLAIGRGLMNSPDLLMLDEPSLGLAPMLVSGLFEQIQQINKDGTAVFLVEQNARRALSIADRAYVIELGQIRHEGTGQELLDNPEVQRAYLGG